MANKEDAKPPASTPVADPGDAPAAPAPTRERNAGKEKIVVERRRGFFARWLARLVALLLFLAIVLLLVFVGVSLVLRSDVPRSMAESVAARAAGLELGIGGLDVGWGGDVTISDLVVRLPGLEGREGEKLLEVPRLHAEIGSLPVVALDYLRGASPRVRRVEIDSPVVYATQDEQEGWNLLRAAALVGGGGGADPEQPGSVPRLPPLPEIRLTDGRIVITTPDGTADVAGLRLTGSRANPLVYTVDGEAEGMTLAGELFPATGRRQQAQLTMDQLPPDLRTLFGLPEVALTAQWNGGLTAGGVEGVIDLTEARVDEIVARGQLRLTSTDGVTTIRPIALPGETRRREGVIATNIPGAGAVNVLEGAIIAEGGELRVEQLLMGLMGGEVLVSRATIDPGSMGVELEAFFTNLQRGEDTRVSGTINLTGGYDAFGRPDAMLTVAAAGSISGTAVERLAVEVTAQGQRYHDWRTLDIMARLLDSPLLIRAPEAPTTIPEAEALVLVRLDDPERPRVELSHMRSLDPDVLELRASGVYFTRANPDHEAGDYLFSFEQRGFPVTIPRTKDQLPLHLGIDLRGQYNPSAGTIAPVEITRLFGELGETELRGTGQYVIKRDGIEPEPPLTLSLTLTRDARMPAPITPAGGQIAAAQRELAQPAPDAAAEPGEVSQTEARTASPLRGMISSWLEVSGDPLAMQFEGAGGIETAELAVGPFELGTIQSQIELTLTRDHLAIYTPRNERRLALDEQYAQLFGAHIDFEAEIPFREDLPGHISIDVQDMHVDRLAEAVAMPAVNGTLNARLDIDLTGLSPRQATAEGWIDIQDLTIPHMHLADRVVIGRPPEDPEAVDDPRFRPRGGRIFTHGSLQLPVRLEKFDQESTGPVRLGTEHAISFDLHYDMADAREVQVLNLEGSRYPIVLQPEKSGGQYVDAAVSVSSPGLRVALENGTPEVHGDLRAEADVFIGERPYELSRLADGVLEVEATSARVEVNQLLVDFPDIGVVSGGGTVMLEDVPGASRIWLHGQALDLAAIADTVDLPQGTEGMVDFSLTVQPGPGERPLGEVLVNLSFSGDGARWRSVEIDQGQVMAYLSRIPLPDDSPSRGQFDFTLITTERVRLQLADGVIDGYFRLRNRGRSSEVGRPTLIDPLAAVGDDWYVNATLDAEDLSVAQIEALREQPEGLEGRLDLSLIAYGNLNPRPGFGQTREDLPRFPLNGEGTLAIRDGVLGNFNLFQDILDIVNVITRNPQRDSLNTRFRLEQGNGTIDSLTAFVDGTEIRLSGRLRNVLDVDETTIELSGVGFVRPLSQIPLPFFREADEILGVIQSNATAVRATGPLLEPDVRQVLISEIAETLRVLIVPTFKRR